MKIQERQIRLLYLLRGSAPSFTRNLAETLGVSQRTIFRDLQDLAKQGIPIAFDDFKGHYITGQINIPPIKLTERELLILSLGMAFITSQPDNNLVNDANSLLTKILGTLPPEASSLVLGVLDKTQINPDTYIVSNSAIDWPKLLKAVLHNHKLIFSYRKIDSEHSEKRTIVPTHIQFYADHWTITGHDLERKGTRSFRIQNISNLTIDATFTPPLTMINTKKDGGNSSGYLIKIQVETYHQSQELAQNLPTKNVSIEETNDQSAFIISFKFPDLKFINKYLLQFGSTIKVLSPDELISYRRLELDNMLSSL